MQHNYFAFEDFKRMKIRTDTFIATYFAFYKVMNVSEWNESNCTI